MKNTNLIPELSQELQKNIEKSKNNLVGFLSHDTLSELSDLHPVRIIDTGEGYLLTGKNVIAHIEYNGAFVGEGEVDIRTEGDFYRDLAMELNRILLEKDISSSKVDEFASEIVKEVQDFTTLDQRISELGKLQFFINQLGYCSSKVDYTEAMKILYFVKEKLK